MKKPLFKQLICVTLATMILLLSSLCAFGELPKETTASEETPIVTPAPTPVPNTRKLPALACKSGVYEELNLTDGWEENEGFTNRFYVQNYTGVGNDEGMYFLKIEKFESAYTVFLNGVELASNQVQ